jgi:hypothetical protein
LIPTDTFLHAERVTNSLRATAADFKTLKDFKRCISAMISAAFLKKKFCNVCLFCFVLFYFNQRALAYRYECIPDVRVAVAP